MKICNQNISAPDCGKKCNCCINMILTIDYTKSVYTSNIMKSYSYMI